MQDAAESTEPDLKEPPKKPSIALLKTFTISWKTELLAVMAFLLALILLRFKAIVNIDKLYLGSIDGDAGLYVWLLQSNIQDLLNLPWFNKLAFYPYSLSLAWSDNFILPSIFSWLFLKTGLSITTVYNLIVLAATFLNGYLTYRLAYRVSGDSFCSWCGGMLFMSCSYLSHQLGHPQLQFFFFVPLVLIFTFKFITRRTYLNAFLIGIALFLSFLTSVYYTVFAAIAFAITVISVILLRPKAFNKKDYIKLVLGLIIGLMPTIPFVFPYLLVKATFGERYLYEAYYFSANAWSYISSAPENIIYGLTSNFSKSEALLFPGLVVTFFSIQAFYRLSEAKKLKFTFNLIVASILLALAFSILNMSYSRLGTTICFWAALILFPIHLVQLGKMEQKLGLEVITARNIVAIFSFLAFIFLVLSFGPLGNPEKGQAALSPYRLFYSFFPGVSAIRAVSRFGIMLIFCFHVLFVLALHQMQRKKEWRHMIALPLLFALIENAHSSYALSSERPQPEIFHRLSQMTEKNLSVIALPYAGELDSNKEVKSWSDYARLNLTYLLWSKDSNRHFVNGYSGQKTKLMRELPRELHGFPSERSLRAFSEIAGLRYIIYVPSLDQSFDASIFLQRLREVAPYLRTIANDVSGTYLFENKYERAIDGDYVLITPSYIDGILTLELRSSTKTNKTQIEIEVFAEESIDKTITSLHISGDGDWSEVQLELKKAQFHTRPHRLKFRINSDASVVVRKTEFRAK